MRLRAARLLLPVLAAVSLSGCVVITHTSDDGTKKTTTRYVSPAFGTKVISDVDFQAGKLGSAKSEQTQLAEAIAAGVAAGMRLK